MLTNQTCKTTKPTDKVQKLFDGKGLYLEIKPNGSKHWRYKYTYFGKEKLYTIGRYPDYSLAEAREIHRNAHKQVADGMDPNEEKRRNLLKQEINVANTFEKVALEWLEIKSEELLPKTQQKIRNRLERNLFGVIGDLPITAIDSHILLKTLKEVEARGVFETTNRLRQYCSQIFHYAVATHRAEHDPTVFLNRALKTKRVEHLKALPLEELPTLLDKIHRNEARLYAETALALKLILLTFVRKIELAHAKWSEINLDERMWVIPAERMKMKKEHLVPLSKQAAEIFAELKGYGYRSDFVFPNQKSLKKPMHPDTILRALYRLGYKGTATVHGFRALAMTTIKEKLNYRHEIPNRQLAHARGNAVDAAYDRAEFLDERKRMMQDWADFLEGMGL